MFATQANFFRSMADHETFALTQRVFHLLKTDFDLQHLTAVRYRKPKYGIVLRRPMGPERQRAVIVAHAAKPVGERHPSSAHRGDVTASLEDAFISYLEEAAGIDKTKKAEAPQPATPPAKAAPSRASRRFDPGRLWAYARRETMELLRDPIRLSFAFVGPVILMLAFGYGITFDVENLKFAAFDQDETPESHRLIENFSGSRYFSEQRPISSAAEIEHRMKSGELAVAVEIPAGFGRDLASLRPPEVAVWIDGAMPFRGETAKGYVTGLGLKYAKDLAVERLGPNMASNVYLGGLNLENRFRYNQAFKSVFAMVPTVIVMMLILIPAIMATIAVVLEKETGSIANFRSTPISKFEFLA